jgi:hypothetical protein
MKGTSKFVAIVLSILLSIVLVAPAETYDKTLFMEEKNNLSNEMNIRTLLGVEDTRITSGIRNFLIVLDISEALEKFYHGEYNDGAAILAKVGVTTFSAIAGIIAAAIDVGTVCRDKIVETVFGPQVQKFYEEYHKARMDDLKRLLDEKKLGFNGADFANWATDADGAVADKSGSSDVKFFVDDKVIGPSANRGLYNIAQMKIQDQHHSERPWYIKLIGRVAPSKNPVSHEEARDYWLQEWNRKVVIDGMEYIVGMKKQYIETFTGSSTINCVVEVKRPVKGLQYELECYELEWNEIQKPVEGLAGLQVIFLKIVDLDDFMQVTRNPQHKGVVRFELLLPDGKVAQVKDVKFADMMYAAGSKEFQDETGIWREYRAKVDFDWEPPRVGSINIELPSEVKLEQLNIQMGSARVNLTTTGTDSGMPGQDKSGVFSLLQWVNSTSFDVLTLLEQMQFAPESYLIPQQGSAYPSVSVGVSYKIQEKRDDEVVEQDINLAISVDLLEEDNSFAIPAYTRPDYTDRTYEELMAIYKRVASSFISSPGTYPGDLFRLWAELPWGQYEDYTAWKEHITEPANAKLEADLLSSFEAFDNEVNELRKKYATRLTGRVFWSEKQRALRDLQETIGRLCYSRFALPINRDKIISEIDEFMAEAEAVRQEVKADGVLTEKLLASAQRDIVPEIAVQRNLLEVSSHHDLPQKVSRTIADLEDMLADQDFTLGEIAQMEVEPQTLLASFDARLADLEQRAAAGAFYGKRFEQLQAEAEVLGRLAEVLGAATIRQKDSIYRLRDLLRAFNTWASSGTRSVVNLNLDALYQYVTGAEPPVSGGELPSIDAMVEELMVEFYRLTSEEIEYLELSAEFQQHRIKILKDAFNRSGKDNLSPMSALYASHLSLSDLEPALRADGSLQSTALNPARQRARQIEESWRASLLAGTPGYCLATMLGPDIETFIDLCDMPETSEGNAAVLGWHATRGRIEANMEQLETVGIAGLGAMVADACADLDKLEQIGYSPVLAKAAWREHYTILRERTTAARTIGDRYADAMADAIVRLLDVADANFHVRLSKALTLSGEARDKELAELSEMTSDDGMGAVGIGSLSDTQYGCGIAILYGSRNPGPFEAVHLKWSDVVGGWMRALEKDKEDQP